MGVIQQPQQMDTIGSQGISPLVAKPHGTPIVLEPGPHKAFADLHRLVSSKREQHNQLRGARIQIEKSGAYSTQTFKRVKAAVDAIRKAEAVLLAETDELFTGILSESGIYD